MAMHRTRTVTIVWRSENFMRPPVVDECGHSTISPHIMPVVACALLLAASSAAAAENWIGAWATAPQHWTPGRLQSFHNQTVRLIVHTTAGGAKVRIRISNAFGDQPLRVGAAHIARRASGADIDPASDRRLTFGGQGAVTV